MREIIFDTETTGLDKNEDRVIEIGAVELVNRFSTGRTFHVYINPDGREVHPDAQRIHGISNADLAGKPRFAEIADEFCEFIEGAKLVAHNAGFDTEFINAESHASACPPFRMTGSSTRCNLPAASIRWARTASTPCAKRYAIDNSHRTLHGALLDAELLAEVYLELIGGRQAALGLVNTESNTADVSGGRQEMIVLGRTSGTFAAASDGS